MRIINNKFTLKGIVSWDGVLTETIAVKLRPKQSAMYVSCNRRVAHQNQEACRCNMAGTGIQLFAKLHAQIFRGMPQTTRAF
jgi:hypothetical protein